MLLLLAPLPQHPGPPGVVWPSLQPSRYDEPLPRASSSLLFPSSSLLADADPLAGLQERLRDAASSLEPALKQAEPMLKQGLKEAEPLLKGTLEETKKLNREYGPQLQQGLSQLQIEAQRSLKENEPSLRKTADELAPVLSSTLSQLSLGVQKGVSSAAGALQEQLQPVQSNLQSNLDENLKNVATQIGSEPTISKTLRDAAPLLEQTQRLTQEAAPVLIRGVEETGKGLKAAEPVLRKTADDLAPVIKTAGDSAGVQARGIAQKLVDELGSALAAQASPVVGSLSAYQEDALAVVTLVVVPVVLYQVYRFVMMIAAPTLISVGLLALLGLAAELSTTFPSLGGTFEIFVGLAAFTGAGIVLTIVSDAAQRGKAPRD